MSTKRIYSILNHNMVTVAICSNLKVAIGWVNTHPARGLADSLKYDQVYTTIRRSGKFLFELGGMECSIVTGSMLFSEVGAHGSVAVAGVGEVASEVPSVIDEIRKLGFTANFVGGTSYVLVKDERGSFYGGYDLQEAYRLSRERVVSGLIASGRVA
jgi:hypothetical protein